VPTILALDFVPQIPRIDVTLPLVVVVCGLTEVVSVGRRSGTRWYSRRNSKPAEFGSV
jgi:hypothetical protein